MAITSFLLGTISLMCLGVIAGIPAIILGHVAHRRVRREPDRYKGAGLAIAGFAMGYLSIFTSLLLLGVLLPALAKAKARAQTIVCVNNLKQVGLASRVWANGHQDRFPFITNTNQSGPLTAGEQAPPQEAVRVFRLLSNELGSPKILVCPADGFKRPATSFSTLSQANITYVLELGPAETDADPQGVLARCPVHGTVLLRDGSVQQVRWP